MEFILTNYMIGRVLTADGVYLPLKAVRSDTWISYLEYKPRLIRIYIHVATQAGQSVHSSNLGNTLLDKGLNFSSMYLAFLQLQ